MTLTPEQFERRKGERGNVMIMTAILAVGLVLAVGLGIDGARIYMTRAELQNAADAAALAAARELNGGTSGLTDAVAAAQSATLQTNKYGLNRTGGSAPAVTISTVEFAPSLNGPWDTAGNLDATEAKTISYVRVTTLTTTTPVLFGVRALGNNHTESRSAVAGYSAPINTICDFFPIAVALSDPNPVPNTTMTLHFVQGDPGANTLADQDYIIIEVPEISGNGERETVELAAGITTICQTLNTSVPFHITPSANKNNGPKAIAWGANSRFDNPGKNYIDPATYPPDTNIREGITFAQYDNRTSVTPPSHPGKDERRIIIVPIIAPGTHQASPGPTTIKFGAFFLKSQVSNNADLDVEWIDEKLILGRGGFDPNGGCTTLSVPVLYQ